MARFSKGIPAALRSLLRSMSRPIPKAEESSGQPGGHLSSTAAHLKGGAYRGQAVNFLTYADRSFRNSRNRLRAEALATGWFRRVEAYSPWRIRGFVAAHWAFLRASKRGGGYWVWKPEVIRRTLLTMQEGEFLVYLDAGSTIDPDCGWRVAEYLELLTNEPAGVVGFQLDHVEESWTKADLAAYLGTLSSSAIMTSGQILATCVLIRNCSSSRELVQRWLETATVENYRFVDDSPSRLPNAPSFKEHRHDQSILSLLLKQANVAVMPAKEPEGRCPFRRTRRKG